MKYTHLGWVPCLNGHLDFGLMKPGIFGGFTNNELIDENQTHINFSYIGQPDFHARKIILQSKVDWRDSKPADEYDGRYRVFVLAEVNNSSDLDQRFLSGTIFIYQIVENETSTHENHGLEWFQQLHKANSLLLDWKKAGTSSQNWLSVQQELNGHYESLRQQLERVEQGKNFVWRLAFKVEPDGLLFIDNSLLCKKLPDERQAFVVARQAYYYLKYSIHTHKHHNQQADSITSLVQYEEGYHSYLRLVAQLKRELTQIKRTLEETNVLAIDKALGIISYLESFLVSLEYKQLLPARLIAREQNYLYAVRNSFMAVQGKKSNLHVLRSGVSSFLRIVVTWALAWAAIMVTLLGTNIRVDFELSLGPFAFFVLTLFVTSAIAFGYYKLDIYYKKKITSDVEVGQLRDKQLALDINSIVGYVSVYRFLIINDIKNARSFFKTLLTDFRARPENHLP